MPPDIRHQFVSLIDDTGDETIVQGSNWNEAHEIVQGPSALLGRADAAAGQASTTEVPLDPDTLAFVDGKLSVTAPAPTTLPPSGPAGGVLAGTYPNPAFATQPFTVAMGGTGSTTPEGSVENLQAAYVVPDLPALKALASRPPAVVVKTGQGRGTWRWEASSTTAVNDGTVVSPTSGTAGRYKRIWHGPMDASWFGDDGDAIQAAIAAAQADGTRTVYIPDGVWDCDAEIVLPVKYAMRLLGQSMKGTVLKAVVRSPTPPSTAVLRMISFGLESAGEGGVAGVTGGEISNMTIDGGHVAHEGIRLWRARNWSLTDLLFYRIRQGSVGNEFEPSLDTDNKGKAIVLGGYSNTLGNYLSNITILYDEADYPDPADRPWYGILMVAGSATDNLVENVVVKNALHSCIYDDAFGGNMYTGFHPFGYPVGYTQDDEGAVVMATIAGTTMTVTEVIAGNLLDGQPLYDYVEPPDPEIIAPGTTVDSQLSSTEPEGALGGTGTYTISLPHTVAASTRIRAERQITYIEALDYRPQYGLYAAKGFVNVDNCYFDTLSVAGIHLGNLDVPDATDPELPPDYIGHDNLIVSTRHTSFKRLNECAAIEFDAGIHHTVVGNVIASNMGNPVNERYRFLGTGDDAIGPAVRFMNNSQDDPLRTVMVKDLVNWLEVRGGVADEDVIVRTFGDDHTGVRYQTAGSGRHRFETNGRASFWVDGVADMVNWARARGSIAGQPVVFGADSDLAVGAEFPGDTDISIAYQPKGTGTHLFMSGSLKSVEIYGVAAMANWLMLRGSIAADPVVVTADGPGADVDIRLLPKGAGTVSFGTRTASADVPITGYITITDAGGVPRKLAVIG